MNSFTIDKNAENGTFIATAITRSGERVQCISNTLDMVIEMIMGHIPSCD